MGGKLSQSTIKTTPPWPSLISNNATTYSIGFMCKVDLFLPALWHFVAGESQDPSWTALQTSHQLTLQWHVNRLYISAIISAEFSYVATLWCCSFNRSSPIVNSSKLFQATNSRITSMSVCYRPCCSPDFRELYWFRRIEPVAMFQRFWRRLRFRQWN